MDKVSNIVVGLGEIGSPLYKIISRAYPDTIGIDPYRGELAPSEEVTCDLLHICIPGELECFKKVVEDYIKTFAPVHVLIHSSIAPGTTRSIGHKLTWHTPVLGKHADGMEKDMLRHPKFVAIDEEAMELAQKKGLTPNTVLTTCGFDVQYIGAPENAELGKMLSTTLFGFLIAWAQEAEHLSKVFNADYNNVKKLWENVDSPDYKIDGKFGGVIGGHCVMPNIAILNKICTSPMLDFIKTTNERTKIKLGE